MGRTLLEYTTSLEDWILLEHRIARLDYKETADIYLLCCCFACSQNANICVIHLQYFVTTGPDFSGWQEFAGGQGHCIEADLHGEQGRSLLEYTVSCTSLNLY